MIALTGQLRCANAQDLATVKTHLPEHIRLSRAETGCLSFDVVQSTDPMIWQVDETFVDQTAFDTHQTRTRESAWYQATAHIARVFQITPSDCG